MDFLFIPSGFLLPDHGALYVCRVWKPFSLDDRYDLATREFRYGLRETCRFSKQFEAVPFCIIRVREAVHTAIENINFERVRAAARQKDGESFSSYCFCSSLGWNSEMFPGSRCPNLTLLLLVEIWNSEIENSFL